MRTPSSSYSFNKYTIKISYSLRSSIILSCYLFVSDLDRDDKKDENHGFGVMGGGEGSEWEDVEGEDF